MPPYDSSLRRVYILKRHLSVCAPLSPRHFRDNNRKFADLNAPREKRLQKRLAAAPEASRFSAPPSQTSLHTNTWRRTLASDVAPPPLTCSSVPNAGLVLMLSFLRRARLLPSVAPLLVVVVEVVVVIVVVVGGVGVEVVIVSSRCTSVVVVAEVPDAASPPMPHPMPPRPRCRPRCRFAPDAAPDAVSPPMPLRPRWPPPDVPSRSRVPSRRGCPSPRCALPPMPPPMPPRPRCRPRCRRSPRCRLAPNAAPDAPEPRSPRCRLAPDATPVAALPPMPPPMPLRPRCRTRCRSRCLAPCVRVCVRACVCTRARMLSCVFFSFL